MSNPVVETTAEQRPGDVAEALTDEEDADVGDVAPRTNSELGQRRPEDAQGEADDQERRQVGDDR